MQEVVDLLVSNKIHRVYVIDEHNRPTHVISTTDILSIVCQESSAPDEAP